MELKFRTLKESEIDVRVATVTEKGVSLLLYKDARCDMNILDEAVGPMNWQRSHTRDNANCIVSIWDEDKKQWISKEDTGTESFTEKEKGQASDSFKRACFNWGIGRELYTSPFIWIAAKDCNIKPKGNGKFTCMDRFKVKEIAYEDKVIKKLVIWNNNLNRQAYPSLNTASNKDVNNSPNTQSDNKDKSYRCTGCGKEVPYKVAEFSYKKLGKVLCMDCQKKVN
ncbi:hypothetical protein ACSXBY_04365 [Clostridium perfringens]|uniref:hypothetical protein n=1 Tax=Clostridium perfringens TaxID=1502 RepID=UPI00016694C7|nr:hypothetical protein [Clostridium perfringens]EDS81428.1 conserved hypothetical protein [Clostridium perfringens C str. JGS1495]MCI5750130.1 hypothetical protein [Clostridium perfringens]MDY4421647.1 hypothetical protein [Clostridium perfringens]NGT44858.1 hypothetical protein [Clostridium perfringens]PWX24650.1 hypothetical protein CYK65_04590 [Clostridium perfringens]